MILDIGTLMFNMTTNGKGGTPSWGTDMGQGDGYKFSFENYEEMVTSLTYSCVDDIENVQLEFGKGGSRTDDYRIVTASLYKKIFVNGELIPDAEFMLILAKQIINNSGFHIGRRTLKYSPNTIYHGNKINEDCLNKIKEFYGLNNNSAWFINEINLKNQDELHFSLYIVNENGPEDYFDSAERKKAVQAITNSSNLAYNRKKRYKKWLSSKTDFAERTIDNYVRYIDYIKQKNLIDLDLFSTDNVEMIKELIEKFSSVEEYIEYNNRNNRNPINALTNYQKFLEYEKSSDAIIGYNKIYYGAPGTGKSFEIDNVVLKNLTKEEKEERVIRTTFHPEYTYSDFIGQLIPKVNKTDEGEEITYEFNKGPFTIAIEKAYKNPFEMIYLIIEEMSRGNSAAIFGDIFQLLDRKPNGESVYSINNDIIAKDIDSISNNQISIPNNLTILGTVNTSDQNVFVMDTAFKRRFEWKYISIYPVHEDDNDFSKGYKNDVNIELIRGEEIKNYRWIKFYMALNKFIASNEYLGLGEDKQIGQFFIQFENDELKNREKIENKLLHYLWFDIHETSFKSEIKLFTDDVSSFGDLFMKYTTHENSQIFSESFFDLLDTYEWEK